MRIDNEWIRGAVVLTVMFYIGIQLGCAPSYQHTYRDYGPPPPQPVTHSYSLDIVGVDGNPIEGARIKYKLYDRKALIQEKTFVTKSDGKLFEQIQASPDPAFTYVKFYETKFDYDIEKDGYYSINGSISSRSKHYDSKKKRITLIRPIDYLNPSFLYSQQGIALKAKILTFIDLIRLQSLVGRSYLETQSIDLVDFKTRKYLKFKFNTVTVFNSLKLTKYDIGKRLFDEIVRKVLNPLNQYISDPKIFFGYDLNITGYTKSFADKYASPQSIEYRFLMPEEIVKKYKNKDISGQQLLDDSIILMDDERIELKLQ